jgi:YidC/Oxa1 family membrane protein insertase
MQSLLPNLNQRPRDGHTFFLMMMTIILVYLLLFRPPPPQPVDLDKPLVPAEQGHNEPVAPVETIDSGESSPTLAETDAPPQWVTLGSMNPESPYRMLISFTNRGAAPCRIELNTPQYRDVQELSGYLGQIVADQALAEKDGDGVIVQVVGDGTPVQKVDALQVGDKIVQIDFLNRNTGKPQSVAVSMFDDLRNALLNTRPNDFVDLCVVRHEKRIDQLRVKLGQYPKDIIRPESVPQNYEEYRQLGGLRGVVEQSDQLSFLMTMQQIDERELPLPASQQFSNANLRGMIPPDPTLGDELTGVTLRDECWEIDTATENEVVFRRAVPEYNIEVVKTYRLQKKEEADPKYKIGAGYELTMSVAVHNRDTEKTRNIAYQLDGPTGLPLEGGWYAMKMGPEWGSYGIRDIVIRLQGNKSRTYSHNLIHVDKVDRPWIDISPEYIGVDSLFFQCTLKPKTEETWHSKIFPIRVGTKNTDWMRLTDVSFRMWSKPVELPPGGEIEHAYTIFAGPKDTAILAEYDLGETISYGWFWFVAMPLLGILHFFHSLGLSYALAIILLTICVRLLLFPLSIKQVVGAIKMQAIQPELKALAEKYKDDLQARSRAQSELFKKHGYHPLQGCLPIFIQLPIFIGLYKALSIDAGLYGSPLIPGMRWCRDLSAPDMLADWSGFWNWLGWTGFNTGQSGLGPYFNLLPMLTVVLFVVQMVITMPPPTDEQSRMQRKMMQYMMVFMGFLFFKVPSGLCLYFIVSTAWGLTERRFIPKAPPKPAETMAIEAMPIDSKKQPQKKGNAPISRKPEGRFAKWWREVLEKAAEQQKLGQQNKDKERKKKKR